MVGIFPRSLLDAFNQDSLTQMGDAMQSTVNDKVEGFRSLVNPLLHANDAVHQGQLEDIAHDPVNLYQGADPTPYSNDSNPFNAAGLSGQHGLDEPVKPNARSPFPGLTGQAGDPNESSGLSVDQLTTDSANGQDDAITNDGQPQKAGVMKYKPVISQAAATYNVPTDVLAGIMDIESGGRPTPGSAALGPMQVMPFHFKDGEDGNDPTTNINKAAEILAQNYKAYGSWDKAAAAYFGAIDSSGNISNASDGNIDGPGYVARFQAARGRYGDLGVSPSGDLTVPSKQDVGITDQSALDDPDKWSLCGPVAAVLAAQAHGANWTVAQAKALAQKMGTWDSGTGMHGLQSEVDTLKNMGIDASVGTADQDRLAQEATDGNTPIISTPKHYFVAQGYNPDTKEFNVGTTGTIFRGGKQWMTLDEIKSLGGGLDGAAYMDNPSSPTPSSATSTSTTSPSSDLLSKAQAGLDSVTQSIWNEVTTKTSDAQGGLDTFWNNVTGYLKGRMDETANNADSDPNQYYMDLAKKGDLVDGGLFSGAKDAEQRIRGQEKDLLGSNSPDVNQIINDSVYKLLDQNQQNQQSINEIAQREAAGLPTQWYEKPFAYAQKALIALNILQPEAVPAIEMVTQGLVHAGLSQEAADTTVSVAVAFPMLLHGAGFLAKTGKNLLDKLTTPMEVGASNLADKFPDLNIQPVDAKTFHEAVSSAASMEKQTPTGPRSVGETLYVYRQPEYEKMNTYLSADGKTGFAIKPESGDLVSVFNVGAKGAGEPAVAEAVRQGARKLDAFDENGRLPDYYKKFGFEVYKRDKWNPEYAPPGWKGGEPDVVYMRRDRNQYSLQQNSESFGGATVDPKTGQHYDDSQGGFGVPNLGGLDTTIIKERNGKITSPGYKGLTIDDAAHRFVTQNPDTFDQPGAHLGVWRQENADGSISWHLDATSIHDSQGGAQWQQFQNRDQLPANKKTGLSIHDFSTHEDVPVNQSVRSAYDEARRFKPDKPAFTTPSGEQVNAGSALEEVQYRQYQRRMQAPDGDPTKIVDWGRAGPEYIMDYVREDEHGNPTIHSTFTPDTWYRDTQGRLILNELKSDNFRGYQTNIAKEHMLGYGTMGKIIKVDPKNFVFHDGARPPEDLYIQFANERVMGRSEPGGIENFKGNVAQDAAQHATEFGHLHTATAKKTAAQSLADHQVNMRSIPTVADRNYLIKAEGDLSTPEAVRGYLNRKLDTAANLEQHGYTYVNPETGVEATYRPYQNSPAMAGAKGDLITTLENARERGVLPDNPEPMPRVLSGLPRDPNTGGPILSNGQPMWSMVPGAAAGADQETDDQGNPKLGFDPVRGLIGMAAMHGGVEHFGSQAERDAHIANRLTGAPRELVPNRAVPPGEAPSLIRGEQQGMEGLAPHEMLGPNQATPPGEQPRAPQASESMFPGLKPEEMFGPHAAQAPGEAPKAPRDASQPGFKGMAPEDLFNPVTQNKDIPPSLQPHIKQGTLPGVTPASSTPPKGVGLKDWADAIRYSSLLSAPGTTIRNVASGLYQIPRKVLVDFMSQNPGTSLNEAKGAVAGMGTGLRSALETLLTGESSIAQDLKDRLGTSAQSTLAPRLNLADQGGLTGLIGKGLTAVSNVMRAPDEFFHQVALHAELGRLSFARAEELAAKFNVPFDDALQHVLSMNDHETLKKAVDVANKLTYRTPLEGWAKSIQTGVDKVPLGIGKAIVPFYHAVHNIAATTVEELPLIGALRADSSLSRGQKIASQAVSMATAGTALFMAANGNLSGAGPTDQQERDKLTRSGWMPYSFKTPDGAWHSYDNLGPLAGTLSAAANGYEASTDKALDDKGQLARVQRFGQDFARSLINNTPARGVADIYDLTDRKTSQDQVDSVIAGYASQAIPLGGLVNAATSAFDSRTRDPQGVIQRIQSRLGPERGLLPAKLDALGQEIPNPQQGFNAFSPTRQNLQRSNSVEEELAKHNVPLSATGDTIGTNKVKLDQFQEHDLQRRAGANITSGVQVLMSDPRYNALNDTEKEQALTRIRDDATSAAKNSIVDPSVANKKPEGEPQKYEGVKGFGDEYKIDQARAKVNAWKASQKTDNPLPDPSNDEMNLALSSIPTQDYKDYLLQKSGITTNTRRSEAFAFNAR